MKKERKDETTTSKEVNENSTWCCRKMITGDHAAATQSIL